MKTYLVSIGLPKALPKESVEFSTHTFLANNRIRCRFRFLKRLLRIGLDFVGGKFDCGQLFADGFKLSNSFAADVRLLSLAAESGDSLFVNPRGLVSIGH